MDILTPNDGAERRAILATPSYDSLSTLPYLLGKPKTIARPFQQWLAGFSQFLTKHAAQGLFKRLV
jgi:hypothetical protein